MRPTALLKGRPLLIRRNRLVYSIKDRLYALESGRTTPLGRLSSAFSPLAYTPSLCDRLLRNEVSHYRIFADGTEFAIYRREFFARAPGSPNFRRVHALSRGSRPLVISVENENQVVFGEYGSLPRDLPIRIYAARSDAFRFEPVHEFSPGCIKHVHGVMWDPYDHCYWITVGDADAEAGILRMSADFRSVEWLVRGGQEARAVGLMVFADCLVYGMDSERAPNHIMRLEKATGKLTKIRPVEGSCLHCARFGAWMAVSTACEPSRINTDKVCHVYLSKDGLNWSRTASLSKDIWSAKYFQFGTFVLPHCENASFLAYGCQALEGAHGRFAVMSMPQ